MNLLGTLFTIIITCMFNTVIHLLLQNLNYKHIKLCPMSMVYHIILYWIYIFIAIILLLYWIYIFIAA